MNGIVEVGRFLVAAGAVVVCIGFLLLLSDKIPLGRLPGDFRLALGRATVAVPVVTCIVLSVVVTILYNVFSRR